jgi:hypothetical protein
MGSNLQLESGQNYSLINTNHGPRRLKTGIGKNTVRCKRFGIRKNCEMLDGEKGYKPMTLVGIDGNKVKGS